MTEIFVKFEDRFIKIDLSTIRYFEAVDHHVKIHTTKKVHLVLTSLNQLEQKLPKDKFCRIHRSYIVSIPHIVSFDKVEVDLEDITLPIGRLYKHQLKQQVVFINNETVKQEQQEA